MMKPTELCFIDLETTGLDPARHAIVEVGMVRTDMSGSVLSTFETLATFEAKVLPPEEAEVDPKAIAVNGYRRAAWQEAGALPLVRYWNTIVGWLEGRVVAGHNVAFDLGFLHAAASRFGDELVIDRAHLLCTKHLVMPLWISGELESTSLEKVSAALGLTHDRPHSALSDALASAAIYHKLAKRMEP